MNFHEYFQPVDHQEEDDNDEQQHHGSNDQMDTESNRSIVRHEFRLIGITELKHIEDSYEHGSSEVSVFIVYLCKMDKQDYYYQEYYKFHAMNHYSSCSSGYTSATSGEFGPLIPIDEREIGALHFVPKISPLIVDVQFEHDIDEQSQQNQPNQLFTKPVQSICDIKDGQEVVHNSGDGGDPWYPCGACWLNRNKFKLTKRVPSRRPLYILTGESGIGKSFLAQRMLTNKGYDECRSVPFMVYETDTDEQLPSAKRLWHYHVIVVGNKYREHIKQIFNVLQEIEDVVHLIHLTFKRVPTLIDRIYEQIMSTDIQLPSTLVQIICAFATEYNLNDPGDMDDE